MKHYNVLGDGDGGPQRRGPPSEISRPMSPPLSGPMMGPPGPGRMGPPVMMPLPGIPTGIPPGAPVPPLPPGAMLGQPNPFMLPPPPRGYFNDWDRFGGMCEVSFRNKWFITPVDSLAHTEIIVM